MECITSRTCAAWAAAKVHADHLADDVRGLAGDLRHPIWAGFFSKMKSFGDLERTPARRPAGFNKALWFVGAVTASLTAVYMTRFEW